MWWGLVTFNDRVKLRKINPVLTEVIECMWYLLHGEVLNDRSAKRIVAMHTVSTRAPGLKGVPVYGHGQSLSERCSCIRRSTNAGR